MNNSSIRGGEGSPEWKPFESREPDQPKYNADKKKVTKEGFAKSEWIKQKSGIRQQYRMEEEKLKLSGETLVKVQLVTQGRWARLLKFFNLRKESGEVSNQISYIKDVTASPVKLNSDGKIDIESAKEAFTTIETKLKKTQEEVNKLSEEVDELTRSINSAMLANPEKEESFQQILQDNISLIYKLQGLQGLCKIPNVATDNLINIQNELAARQLELATLKEELEKLTSSLESSASVKTQTSKFDSPQKIAENINDTSQTLERTTSETEFISEEDLRAVLQSKLQTIIGKYEKQLVELAEIIRGPLDSNYASVILKEINNKSQELAKIMNEQVSDANFQDLRNNFHNIESSIQKLMKDLEDETHAQSFAEQLNAYQTQINKLKDLAALDDSSQLARKDRFNSVISAYEGHLKATIPILNETKLKEATEFLKKAAKDIVTFLSKQRNETLLEQLKYFEDKYRGKELPEVALLRQRFHEDLKKKIKTCEDEWSRLRDSNPSLEEVIQPKLDALKNFTTSTRIKKGRIIPGLRYIKGRIPGFGSLDIGSATTSELEAYRKEVLRFIENGTDEINQHHRSL